MSFAIDPTAFRDLVFDERMPLIAAVWDSVDAESSDALPTPEQAAGFDRRLAEREAAPGDAIPRETVLAEALERSPKIRCKNN